MLVRSMKLYDNLLYVLVPKNGDGIRSESSMPQFLRQAEQVLHLQYIIDAFWPSRSKTELGFAGAVS